jgi:hypothetical protein
MPDGTPVKPHPEIVFRVDAIMYIELAMRSKGMTQAQAAADVAAWIEWLTPILNEELRSFGKVGRSWPSVRFQEHPFYMDAPAWGRRSRAGSP